MILESVSSMIKKSVSEAEGDQPSYKIVRTETGKEGTRWEPKMAMMSIARYNGAEYILAYDKDGKFLKAGTYSNKSRERDAKALTELLLKEKHTFTEKAEKQVDPAIVSKGEEILAALQAADVDIAGAKVVGSKLKITTAGVLGKSNRKNSTSTIDLEDYLKERGVKYTREYGALGSATFSIPITDKALRQLGN